MRALFYLRLHFQVSRIFAFNAANLVRYEE